MDIDALLTELAARYKDRGYENEWEYERSRLGQTLHTFFNHYGELYEPIKALSLGGSGIALLLGFKPLGGERQVLKMPRPVAGQEKTFNTILAKETEKLRSLRHQNVIRITFQGVVPDQYSTNFYVMEHLEGVEDADEHLKCLPATHQTLALTEIVRGSVEGLAHLHDHGIVHLDIKPANLFVDGRGHVVVADLGFAKTFTIPGQTSSIGGTSGYMHPAYARLMVEKSDQNKNLGGPYQRDDLDPVWDLFSLGTTFLELLSIADSRDPRGVGDHARQFIRLMAYRMLDGNVVELGQLPYNLPARVFSETAYTSCSEVLRDVSKLVGTHNVSTSVPEIKGHQEHVIQAASHGSVSFTPRVQRIIDCADVRRLGQLSQLGLVSFIYPTASHSRLEHTLGTFAMTCRYVRALYNDPHNPLFRQLVTDGDIEALLVAALVHDIGHYPLAHDLEEVDNAIFSHELRTNELLKNETSAIHRAISFRSNETMADGWRVSPERVIEVLDKSASDIRAQILRSCLDGPIDADKLDYLIRDSENLRLPYGKGIDVDKLVQSLTVIAESKLDRTYAHIGIHERGKIAAESLAFARYAVYGAVYWHHAHRSAKAMLNSLGYEALFVSSQSAKRQYRNKFRAQLYAFLGDATRGQGELPLGARSEWLGRSPFLDEGSEKIIEWLKDRGGASAQDLADGLLQRRLYKRALVVSRIRGSALQWNRVEDIYGGLGENWQAKRRVNELLQTFVLDRIRALDVGHATSLSVDDVAQALGLGERGPVILVDYPPDKVGSTETLQYLREASLAKAHSIVPDVETLERSTIWGTIRRESRTSLAKLRVFCHPDLRAAVRAALTREEFEKAIDDALEKAGTEA